jgi:hypothetical protein
MRYPTSPHAPRIRHPHCAPSSSIVICSSRTPNCTLQISTSPVSNPIACWTHPCEHLTIAHGIARRGRTSVLSLLCPPLRDAYPGSLNACPSSASQFVRCGLCPLRAANLHEAYTRRSRRSKPCVSGPRTPHIVVMSRLLNNRLSLHPRLGSRVGSRVAVA